MLVSFYTRYIQKRDPLALSTRTLPPSVYPIFYAVHCTLNGYKIVWSHGATCKEDYKKVKARLGPLAILRNLSTNSSKWQPTYDPIYLITWRNRTCLHVRLSKFDSHIGKISCGVRSNRSWCISICLALWIFPWVEPWCPNTQKASKIRNHLKQFFCSALQSN